MSGTPHHEALHRDRERYLRLTQGLRARDLDAVVCAFPSNVLLLTGYWPVVGTAMALATCNSEIVILAPDDEGELTKQRWRATS